MRKTVHASLFSGFGGPDLAAKWMGWENAFHCEINEFCNTILEYWFPESKTYKDVTTADFTEWRGKIDILTGGFPCQPFSVAGQRNGADDNRYLWPHFLRVIREVRPTWVVGENVGGILTMVQPGEEVEVGCQASLFEENDKETILEQEFVVETICKDLECEGYSVQPILIPACAVGAPHRRDRIWFIAYRTDAGIESVQPRWEDGVLSGTSITDTYGKRCNNRSDNWEERPIYYDWQWCSEKDQSERDKREYRTREACADVPNTTSEGFQRTMRENTKLFTEPFRNFPTQSPVCSRNDGISSRLDGITFPKWRQESVKGFGNAIVPQVIYELFKVIEEIEEKIVQKTNNMKITKDGFVWLTLEEDQAKKIYKHEIDDIYVLYDDDSEGLVDWDEQISEAFEKGNHVGIEVGQLPDGFVSKEKAIEAYKKACTCIGCSLCDDCDSVREFIQFLNS